MACFFACTFHPQIRTLTNNSFMNTLKQLLQPSLHQVLTHHPLHCVADGSILSEPAILSLLEYAPYFSTYYSPAGGIKIKYA
jgi:hypothetical protein